MFTTMLADDHALVRAAIKGLLDREPDIAVIGESHCGRDCISQVAKLKPDLLVLDFALPDISGLEVTEQLMLSNPQLVIVIVSAHASAAISLPLLAAGAQSYLLKNTASEDFLDAIRRSYRGERILSPAIAHNLAMLNLKTKTHNNNPFQSLTALEMNITQRIISGKSTRCIAQALRMEAKTIYNHRSRILKKVNRNNDVELTLLAWRNNLLWLEHEETQ